MFCKKMIYVNWGNIPHLEFDFGPVNLFSGGNGSGKTTAADGIQTLMTAAYENLFTYNPGQDETTQRGRGGKQVRTTESYILGCDDGSYARPRVTDGYIAGVFYPTQGESSEPFTAVMCARASLDTAGSSKQARLNEIIFMILPNEELKISHFVREDKGGKYVVPMTDIVNLLKKEFGKKTVEVFDKKGSYLNRLYGAFRGLNSPVSPREAKHAARTFSNFMAYKPVKSINDFVAREILEPKDLSEDIKQVSELMKTIHGMEEETRQVKDAIENLDAADEFSKQYLEAWAGRCVGEYTELTRQIYVKQDEYLSIKKEQNANNDLIIETESKLSNNENKKSILHGSLIELEAKRQGIPALKDKDTLEKDIERLKSELVNNAGPLLVQNNVFSENFKHIENLLRKLNQNSLATTIPILEQKDFKKTLTKVIEMGGETGIDPKKLFNSDWVGIADLEQRLDKLIEMETVHRDAFNLLYDSSRTQSGRSIRDQILSVVDSRKELQQKLHRLVQEKQAEIQKIEHRSVSYPPFVEQALSAIESQSPQAKPSVLCDFVEVSDPRWQMAIEGYIGGKRFSIIVEPEYEAAAIRIIRNMSGKKNTASIIQGETVQHDALKASLPKDSIFHVMEFNNKIAEYYIKATYGSVVRVKNEEELRRARRGITENGLGSGGYSMYRVDIDDEELVFGKAARERALNAKRKQLADLKAQEIHAEESHRQAATIYDSVEKVKEVKCAALVKVMLDLYRNLNKYEVQLSNLDLTEFKDLEETLNLAKSEYNNLEKFLKDLQMQLGQCREKVSTFDKIASKLSFEKEKLQEQQEILEKTILKIPGVFPGFSSDYELRMADEKAKLAKADFSFADENKAFLSAMERAERSLSEKVSHHNLTSNAYSHIGYFVDDRGSRHDETFFKGIAEVRNEIKTILNTLKNNILVGKHEKLTGLKESFNTAFVTNLCHSIYQSINDGERVLKDLNKELESHRFGTDQERFYFSYEWVPEFKEYQKFFKEVISVPNLGDGSTLFDADISEGSQFVRDKLLSMLLDKDVHVAQLELARISDYRNYREYEIYKEPLNKEPIALSKYGTGSGGQLETPAYIIRSAAFTSALKFNQGKSHCRMVLVDEAFSKMDEARSREVINYLTETLGLQLIFIMPTSKSGPFMDLISHQVVFSKCPVSEKIGELNTRVNVNRSEPNPEKIKQLWENHRKSVRHQVTLDFMEEFT